MSEKEFDDYWRQHSKELIASAPPRLAEERRRSLAMSTAGDWLLAVVPFGVMAGVVQAGPTGSEMLNFLLAAVAGIVAYALCQMAKPYVTGKRSVADIDADIRRHFHDDCVARKKKGEAGS